MPAGVEPHAPARPRALRERARRRPGNAHATHALALLELRAGYAAAARAALEASPPSRRTDSSFSLLAELAYQEVCVFVAKCGVINDSSLEY